MLIDLLNGKINNQQKEKQMELTIICHGMTLCVRLWVSLQDMWYETNIVWKDIFWNMFIALGYSDGMRCQNQDISLYSVVDPEGVQQAPLKIYRLFLFIPFCIRMHKKN